MTLRKPVQLVLATALLAQAVAGCSHRTPTEVWPPITDPLVFGDTFGSKVVYQAFAGSKLDAVAIDSTVSYSGTASIRITVPNPGDPTGTYAGGAFTTPMTRDLAGYNALSFWVKASRAASLDVAGLGNDNTGTSKFTAQRSAIPMTTSWTQVLVPIPNPARLTAEGGMFFFAEGPQSGSGLTMWVDQVQFVNTAVVTNPRPALTTQTINTVVGANVDLSGATKTVYTISGFDQTVTHFPGYFDFTSSNPALGTVTYGTLRVLAGGVDTLTAKLGSIPASGSIAISAVAPPAAPAPTPTVPAANVISLYSGAYTNVPVDTWNATWGQATLTDISIAGNATKLYTKLVFAGIDFSSHPVDATTMTTFHMDVFIPSDSTFKVKLVDYGANGVYGGGDDTQCELTFRSASVPAGFTNGAWSPLEIPLASFATTMTARAHVAQLIISGNSSTVYVDNVYFHK